MPVFHGNGQCLLYVIYFYLNVTEHATLLIKPLIGVLKGVGGDFSVNE